MKLRVIATPKELEEKAPDLVKSLGDILRPVSPDIADALEKAIPRKEKELKFPVTRTLNEMTKRTYEKQMELMLKDIGKVLDGSLKKSESDTDMEKATKAVSMKEMKAHFEKRTNRHIELTQKYCGIIAKKKSKLSKLVDRGKVHDQSKYGQFELEPYVYLTWRYKCADDGTECKLPEGMEGKIHEATKHHILNNRHHPEFHQGKTTGLLNKEDRDKPPSEMVDATGMTDLDIAEMVADWCAMSEERGNSPKSWADKNVNIRWKFTRKQTKLIYELIDIAWKDVKKSESPDYTEEIVAKNGKKYEEIKAELLTIGYEESDFVEGGQLYGQSTNQLIDLAREKRDATNA